MRPIAYALFCVPLACSQGQAGTSEPRTAQGPAQQARARVAEASRGGSATATPAQNANDPNQASRDPNRYWRLSAVSVALADYVGVPVEGTARVTEVISDRGFWVDAGGEHPLLAVVREDVPRHEMIDINEGQRLKFAGLVLSKSAIDDLSGSLERQTRNAILQQPAFLAVDWRDISIMEEKPASSRFTSRATR